MTQEQENKQQEQKQNEPTTSQLQEKIDQLQQQMAAQAAKEKEESSKKEQEKQEVDKEKTEEQLKKEADIRKAMENPEKASDVDIDDLSNKEILDIVADAFDQSIEARLKRARGEVKGGIDQVSDKVSKIEQYLLNKEAQDGVKSAKQKFQDFDKYQEDMKKLWDKHPTLTPEQAYLLAKSQKASTSPPQKKTETEKPISLGTRSEKAEERHKKRVQEEEKKGEPAARNRRKFKQLLNDAAERAIANKS